MWAKKRSIKLDLIQPDKPQQNSCIERSDSIARYEWLLQYKWENLEREQDYAKRWTWSHDHDRLNMALRGFTLKQRLAMAATAFTSAAQ